MTDGKKVCAIVCEYNPFHNGHKYHIEQTRKLGYDYIVCAMSGSMVQRGDVAIYDKWFRAKTAVSNGADLVIEIPTYYVLRSAQKYAFGAIKTISSLGFVDALSFGSECGSIETLTSVSDIIRTEPERYKNALHDALDKGLSYPAACENALSAAMGENTFEQNPNDVLAINYISELKKINSDIEPISICRKGNYHDIVPTSAEFASATAVRSLIKSSEDVSPYVPNKSCEKYFLENMESLIIGSLRLRKPTELDGVIGMEPGLANRLISAAEKSSDINEFFANCTTKRYTLHRIRRTVLCSLLGINHGGVLDYIRVLAFNVKGKNLLSAAKKKSLLNIVTKTADFSPCANSVFKYDIAATDISALCCSDITKRKSGKDFTTSPQIV